MKEWILEEETKCPQKVEPTSRKLHSAEGNAAEEMGVTLSPETGVLLGPLTEKAVESLNHMSKVTLLMRRVGVGLHIPLLPCGLWLPSRLEKGLRGLSVSLEMETT